MKIEDFEWVIVCLLIVILTYIIDVRTKQIIKLLEMANGQ